MCVGGKGGRGPGGSRGDSGGGGGGGGGVVSIRVRSNPIPAIVARVTLALCPHAGLV